MKRISVLVVVAAFGFAVAGCGSAKKSVPGPSTGAVESFRGPGGLVVTHHATIRQAKPGTPIRCSGGGPTVTVPADDVAAEAVVSGPAPAIHVSLTRSRDGTVTVDCTKK